MQPGHVQVNERDEHLELHQIQPLVARPTHDDAAQLGCRPARSHRAEVEIDARQQLGKIVVEIAVLERAREVLAPVDELEALAPRTRNDVVELEVAMNERRNAAGEPAPGHPLEERAGIAAPAQLRLSPSYPLQRARSIKREALGLE